MSPIPPADGGSPLLVVVPNVPAADGGDRVFLDIKAADGMRLYARYWPGSVRCLSRAGDPRLNAYGQWYARDTLPFEVRCLPPDATAAVAARHCAGAAVVLAGADHHLDLDFPDALAPTPVVLTIEYTLRTRLDILRLGKDSLPRKLRSALWLTTIERGRQRALRRAAGIQANGAPAFAAYAALSPSPLLFFDTRLRDHAFIGRDGAEAKAIGVANGKRPLRLAFSGRLEPMKGADRLVPIMRALGECDVGLDIFGTGSLMPGMAAEIARHGLGDRIRLHGPIDFERALVPRLKTEIDLFLCPHPQADPSCTYLETLGCGVPIVGFLNEAFRGVLALGACGIGVPIGDVAAAARAIAALNGDRDRLANLTRGAAAVARGHLFETVAAQRIAHLRRVAGTPAPAVAMPRPLQSSQGRR